MLSSERVIDREKQKYLRLEACLGLKKKKKKKKEIGADACIDIKDIYIYIYIYIERERERESDRVGKAKKKENKIKECVYVCVKERNVRERWLGTGLYFHIQ